jgi:hypothetical protein
MEIGERQDGIGPKNEAGQSGQDDDLLNLLAHVVISGSQFSMLRDQRVAAALVATGNENSA